MFILMFSAAGISAQGTFGQRSLGGGVSGSAAAQRNQGLTQTGQLTSDAAIDRSVNGFVGASSSNNVSLRSQTSNTSGFGNSFGNSGLSGFNSFSGQRGFGGNNNFGNRNPNALQTGTTGNTTSQPAVRVRLRVGFDVPIRQPDRRSSASDPTLPPVERHPVAMAFQSRLNRLPHFSDVSNVQVQVDGRTAAISGTVSSRREHDLILRLALLEPGIDVIEDQLSVAANPLP